jgi:ATP-dependent DNA helicase RecG
MTATPIPRTAAMLIYGDLDRSELRELPPGRTPIVTKLVEPNPLDQAAAWEALRREVAAGHQAYVVCPLVDDRGKVEAKAATAEFERLQADELHDLRVGLLHGQMPSKDKEPVMRAYRAGEIDVLVATTVIEVGVDVPAATVMLIENAERLGLAQLHQLRGRIGRGPRDSWCLLFGKPSAGERFAFLEKTTDGFEIAEEDLRRRGMGDLAGLRQSGEGFAGALEADLDLLIAARDLAASRPELIAAYARDERAPIAP